jgi:hypothetical protein
MMARRLRITDGAPVEADYAKTVEEWHSTRPGAGCGSITRTESRTKRIVSPGRRRVDLHSATAACPDGGARRAARCPVLCTIRVARLRWLTNPAIARAASTCVYGLRPCEPPRGGQATWRRPPRPCEGLLAVPVPPAPDKRRTSRNGTGIQVEAARALCVAASRRFAT